jgi:predicted nucleic acid-binding protein
MWVIDTDSIIKLYTTYSPDYFSPLWIDIDDLFSRRQLWSTKVNYAEIEERTGQEYLLAWKHRHADRFVEIDEDSQKTVREIVNRFPDLIEIESDHEQADPYLIALAIKLDAVVITEEKRLDRGALNNPQRKANMRIPNVCDQYDITSMDLVQFINSPEWRRR